MDQSKLTPKEQATLFDLLKKSGAQPTSGGMDQSVPDPGAPMDFSSMQQQPGDKMHPGEATQQIISGMMQGPQAPSDFSKATGPQLVQTSNGLGQKVPVDQPLLALLGLKKTVPVSSPDYYSAAQAAGIEKYLPSNLPRTPQGTPFVGDKSLDNARQLAAAHKDAGSRLLSPEESKLTIEYWKEAAPTLVPMAEAILQKSGGLPEWLGKAGPSYRLKRSEFASVQGFTEDGAPVEYDQTEKKWFVGGKETPADQIGRLLSKTRPQMSNEQINEVTNLLNTQSQLKEVGRLFDPSATGPVESRLLEAQKLTGIQLPDMRGLSVMTDRKMQLQSVLASSINDYIKATTGTAMTDNEARRIISVFPNAKAADSAFLPVLAEVNRIVNTKLDNRLNVLETQDTVGVKKLREMAKNQVNPYTGQPTAQPAPKKKSLNDIFGK